MRSCNKGFELRKPKNSARFFSSSVLFFPSSALFFPKKTDFSFQRRKKKSPANPLVYWTFWRRVRDSNPRSLSGHSISSAAPSTSRTTLRVIFSLKFRFRLDRTTGQNNLNIQFFELRKPAWLLDFWVDEMTTFRGNFESGSL